MALRGTLLIRSGPQEKWAKCGAALVRPDAAHEVDATRTKLLIIGFVDAESELGAALAERIQAEIVRISAKEVARWRAALGSHPNDARVEEWVRTELLKGRKTLKIHPRVNRVLRHLRQRLGRGEDFSLKTLARISGLSPSRFMHVFTESVGVPLRPYILWLRLQRGACELMNGATATEAAHISGFSDAAHLTRTFRRMLGTTPTDLALRKRMSRGISVERN